jgi:hypothetical protein
MKSNNEQTSAHALSATRPCPRPAPLVVNKDMRQYAHPPPAPYPVLGSVHLGGCVLLVEQRAAENLEHHATAEVGHVRL